MGSYALYEGWYDQFLSVVPQEWLRVCFCFMDQYTTESLERKAWDQLVDRIGVVDRSTNQVVWNETHARATVASSVEKP
jgi:hypothetical protein